MKLITQPKHSTICGHCSMAMVLEEDVNVIVNEMGFWEKGGSTVYMKEELLTKRGYKFNNVMWMDNRKHIDISGKGVISITNRGRKWGHAMAFEDGKIYDPGGYVYDGIKEMRDFYRKLHGAPIKVYSVITVL